MAVQGMNTNDINRALGLIPDEANAKTNSTKPKPKIKEQAPPIVKVEKPQPSQAAIDRILAAEEEAKSGGKGRLSALAGSGPGRVIRKIGRVLQDNRMKSAGKVNKEMAAKFKKMNMDDRASQTILKKILNIIFVTTGMALFVSVVIVIIYTSIGKFFNNNELIIQYLVRHSRPLRNINNHCSASS